MMLSVHIQNSHFCCSWLVCGWVELQCTGAEGDLTVVAVLKVVQLRRKCQNLTPPPFWSTTPREKKMFLFLQICLKSQSLAFKGQEMPLS